MEEVWTVVQCYGAQSMDEREHRVSELLMTPATIESEKNSCTNHTLHESNDEVVYLS